MVLLLSVSCASSGREGGGDGTTTVRLCDMIGSWSFVLGGIQYRLETEGEARLVRPDTESEAILLTELPPDDDGTRYFFSTKERVNLIVDGKCLYVHIGAESAYVPLQLSSLFFQSFSFRV